MNKLGIDPGVTGAIAQLDEQNHLLGVWDMPLMTLGKGKKHQVNASELKKIITRLEYPANIAYLEAVSAMPGQGVSACFNFGLGYGVIQGVLAGLDIPLVLVRPNIWKRNAGLLGSEKDAARTMAQHLYPKAELGLKKHIGRADAILIARFGGPV